MALRATGRQLSHEGVTMSEGPRRRWLTPALIAGAVAVLVIIALVREPAQLDPSTPEGVVQRYLQAVSDEDYETAFIYLDPDFYADCHAGDLAATAPTQSFGAVLGESFEAGLGVIVEVDLRFGASEGPFGGGWSTYESFMLIESSESWWITGDAWPYFSWDCGGDI